MDWSEKDKQYVWHPFTQMKGWMEQEDMPVIERGEGLYLFDTQGRRYLDGVSSLWCNVFGHRRAEIDQAIRDQLDKIAHTTFLGLSNVPAIRLAEKLVHIAPKGLTRVFYSDSGSEAVEVALKMAFQYWLQCGDPTGSRRTKFLRLAEGYHGDTLGAVSVGGVDLFHSRYRPLLFETVLAPTTYAYRSPYRSLEECGEFVLRTIASLMEQHRHELAGFIMEPLVQGASGMILQPRGFLKRVRELCDRNGVLLILDEVATGFGRTGTMFACEQEGVTPDLMVVAKGITGGYLPLSATLATEKIFQAFLGEPRESKTFFHGHTYTGNPLACAAALATLEIFEREKTLETLRPKIDLMRGELKRFYDLPAVGEVRQCGFMVGIELVRDRQTRQPYPSESRVGHEVILEARRRGVLLRPLGDVVVLMPPLSITEPQLRELIETAYQSIRAVTDKQRTRSQS